MRVIETRRPHAALLIALISATLAGCSATPAPESSAAAVSQQRGWVDAALLAQSWDTGDRLVSNAGNGN